MSTASGSSSVSVALVSKGRPLILADTLTSLSLQTFKPQEIVIVVPSPEDLPSMPPGQNGTKTIIGPLGATVQRNSAISAIPLSIDYVAFFDDDMELSPDYLEQAVSFLDRNPSVAALSGLLLANGGITREQAQSLTAHAKPEQHFRGMFLSSGKDHILHGCNMVIRRHLLAHEQFDEDLPLYSYGEDYDITVRLERYGLVGKYALCTGVHLESTSGRVREVQRGYSLVANNLYFLKKGTVHLPPVFAWLRFWTVCVLKPILSYTLKILRRDRSRDWPNRLKGVFIALRDILQGRCRPDRIKEL